MTAEFKKIEIFFDSFASQRDFWRKKNSYYYKQVEELYKFLIPQKQRVLDIGSGTGDLLASVNPSYGVGIDLSQNMLTIAKRKFPKLKFKKGYAENLNINEKFDYIIMSDLVGMLIDVQEAFKQLDKASTSDSRIIINYYNYLWEPLFLIGAKLGLKMPQPLQNWLSRGDIRNMLELSNYEVIKDSTYLLIPFRIPLISSFLNKYIARLPLIRNFCLLRYFIVRKRPTPETSKEYSVSIILPARNEEGNIERATREIPNLGKRTQIIFVEDHSTDNTKKEIERVKEKYKGKKEILNFVQKNEYGKAAAVRKGFKEANGDILIIFDSDITTEPKDLIKFYETLRDNKAEFIQGSRLVYPMEKEAMRFLNILGNKFFSLAFTFLLDQPIKDTLCGTKALFRFNYEKVAQYRTHFGLSDPFGDFDLIFGSSKLNLKIAEIPVRYKARSYGKSNISRFKHGWLLLKMTFFAARKIKFF